MAVTQISRIQHRRGLQQDLPQLASAELGWSVDTRRLYIGNGTLEEGAPTVGVTEILTEYSDLSSINATLNSYTFYGNSAGYAAMSGSSLINPVIRTFNTKLDDFVSIRDFGATGDGITDDTVAINRALQQIYKTGVNETQPLARRTIYFPGGTYRVTDSLLIPPYARLIGDGASSTVINQVLNKTLVKLSDSGFNVNGNLGLGGTTLPNEIVIQDLKFFNSNTVTSVPMLEIDSASNVTVYNTSFVGSQSPGFYSNLVSINSSVQTPTNLTFDSCKFLSAGTGINFVAGAVTNVRLHKNYFDHLVNCSISVNDSLNLTSINNYHANVAAIWNRHASMTNVYQFGDQLLNDSTLEESGMFLGNIQHSTTLTYVLGTTPVVIPLVANSDSFIDYIISNSSARRLGTFNLTNYGLTETTYADDYVETSTSIKANLYANATSIVASVDSGDADFQFNFRRFRLI